MQINTGFGQALADETIQALPQGGSVVVVSLRQPDDRLSAFEAELKKQPRISLRRDVIQFEPGPGPGLLPRTTFRDVIGRYPDAALFIFLVELPEWGTAAPVVSDRPGLKLMAADQTGRLTRYHYGGYYENGTLLALFGSARRPLTAGSPMPATAREWFDRSYQIYKRHDYMLFFQ